MYRGTRPTAPREVTVELWHNPRCSKSRAAKELLDERGAPYRLRLYLDAPPSTEELDRVLRALGQEPWDFARMKEEVARSLDLAAWPRDRQRWLDAMVAHPRLIERPVLVTPDGRAALGRPIEALMPLLVATSASG